MYYSNNNHYRTFICYRRKRTDPTFAASEDVAGMLHWWFNNNRAFRDIAPALFEECYPPSGTLTFDEPGIRSVMPQISNCFVVICQDFFRNILDVFYNIFMEDPTLPEEEQITKTVRYLDNGEIICYLEIKHALQQGCRLCPVFVSNGNQSPYGHMDAKKVSILQKILGEGSEILFSKINAHTVDYAQLAGLMGNMSWSTISMEEAAVLMQNLEKTQQCRDLLAYIKEVLSGDTQQARDTRAIKNRIKDDLKLCAMTVFAQQRPGRNAAFFRAGNPKLIYDPVRLHHDDYANPPFLAACLVETFLENSAKLGLQSDAFRYWNVDLDPRALHQEKTIGLSVCAVCFGTLSTYHRVWKDSLLLEDGQISQQNRQMFLNTVQSGVNLLLALRNPYTKTWPSSWVFDTIIGVEGTTNQTTLSLSTLMSCGFLSPNGENVTPEILKARYGYIWESIQVLLSWSEIGCTYDGMQYKGWRYTENSTNAPAVLPTVFAFDTLCKLRQNLLVLVEYYRDRDSRFCDRLTEDKKLVEEELAMIMQFFRKEQRKSDDHMTGAFKRYADSEYSITHTAYVIKSLYQYICSGGPESQMAEEIMQVAIRYFVPAVQKQMYSGKMVFDEFERFENFCDSDPENPLEENLLESTYGDRYEHCAELIIAETLVKIAEYTRDENLYNDILQILEWIFTTYSATSVVRYQDTIRIKGCRTDLCYPIYYLYYYRMFLWDYLSLLKKKEG
ncbi:MAG: hypothetical protein IKK11_04100 [Oscillospiraceae bacterium]|nr:hypothetical protein [Oscillospiraceae bacterium]